MDALKDYLQKLETYGDKAIEAIKEQIDIETDTLENQIKDNIPTNTGGLKNSLTRKAITDKNKYGFILSFEGYDPNGVPYEKIANSLNKGTSTIKPRKFITRAIKNLKGLDERVMERFEGKIE